MLTPSRFARVGSLVVALTAAGCASGPVRAPLIPTDPLAQGPEALIAGTPVAIAYSGYRSGQHPDRGDGERAPTAEQVRQDLELLVNDARFSLIRLYDSGNLSQTVLEVIAARALPIKLMLGAWLKAEISNHEGCAWLKEPIPDAVLAANKIANAAEVARAIALAKRFPDIVVAVNVGNEALVTWNDHLVALDSLLAYAREVKSAIRQPVTTADNYAVFRDHGPALATVLDFFAVHTYPVWEGKPMGEAMDYTIANLQSVRAAAPGVPIAIGEAGWPTTASEFPDRANQGNQWRYAAQLTRWAAKLNITTFLFEAFDEDWKGDPADPDGAEKHWGLYTIDRKPKLVMRPGNFTADPPLVSTVRALPTADGWTLERDGEPYPIRGVGGDWNLELARSLGANSVRTWGEDDWPRAFGRADALGMTVLAGIWLSHDPRDYADESYRAAKRQKVEALAQRWAAHPALLAWCIGNEIQLGANIPAAWELVEDLARIIRRYDSNRPIATATAHSPPEVLDLIVAHAPSVNLVAVNSYAGLPAVMRDVGRSRYSGPIAITEWGPNGHWETGNTSWGRPIEQLGAEKVATYRANAQLLATMPVVVGSYVFLWGQKQERTPTWYSMFVEAIPDLGLNGEATGAVDVAQQAWSGREPDNHAPILSALTLNGRAPTDNVILKVGQPIECVASAVDPDGDPLRWAWELLVEPVEVGDLGAPESRPPRAAAVVQASGATAKTTLDVPGEYRLFAYALDGRGKVATGNFPFKVVRF